MTSSKKIHFSAPCSYSVCDSAGGSILHRTTDPTKVTCAKCRRYLDNPAAAEARKAAFAKAMASIGLKA